MFTTPTKKELWALIQIKDNEIKQLNKELQTERGWSKYWEGIALMNEGAIPLDDLVEGVEEVG